VIGKQLQRMPVICAGIRTYFFVNQQLFFP